MAASEARQSLAEVLNRVTYGGERVILHRRGKDLAALVPMEDITLLRAMEDRYDVDMARKALKEPGAIPWERVKEKLGL